MQEAKIPDGTSPFEDRDCGHLPCPPWLGDEEEEEKDQPEPVAVQPQEEPELDPPHHVHGLWVVLGLGEE